MKRLTILMAALSIGVAAIAIAASGKAAGETIPASVKIQPAPHSSVEQRGAIDGASTPQRIPDRVAYSLVFRLIFEYQNNEVGKRRIKSYIRQMGFEDDADVSALLAVATEFRKASSVLDAEVANIKTREYKNKFQRSSATQYRLMELRGQRDRLVEKTIMMLSERLNNDGFEKLRYFINERVKRRIKMRPSASAN